MKTQFLFICLFPFIIACSTSSEKCTKVAQDRIHQYLSASYDGQTSTTSVFAEFRFGGASGTTLELVDNCSVSHGITELSKTTFLGTSYQASLTGLKPDHLFRFTDANGKVYSNSTSIQTVEFDSLPTTLSRAAGYTVSFTAALAAGEKITVTIFDARGGSESKDSDAVRSTSVTFDSKSLERLVNGAGSVRLRRFTDQTLSQGTDVGGRILSSYFTPKRPITITP